MFKSVVYNNKIKNTYKMPQKRRIRKQIELHFVTII